MFIKLNCQNGDVYVNPDYVVAIEPAPYSYYEGCDKSKVVMVEGGFYLCSEPVGVLVVRLHDNLAPTKGVVR